MVKKCIFFKTELLYQNTYSQNIELKYKEMINMKHIFM